VNKVGNQEELLLRKEFKLYGISKKQKQIEFSTAHGGSHKQNATCIENTLERKANQNVKSYHFP